jgi:hypothetical protein
MRAHDPTLPFQRDAITSYVSTLLTGFASREGTMMTFNQALHNPTVTRRKLLIATGCAALLCPCEAHSSVRMAGCAVLGATSGQELPFVKLSSSGKERIDLMCRSEAPKLNTFFGVNADFGFYDDATGANALTIQSSSGDGTILMGIALAKSVLRGTDVELIVVMAHEWGHIKQYQARSQYNWGVRYELDADRQAGTYFRDRWSEKQKGILAAELFFRLGDNEFSNADHHGTPIQSRNVFLDGAGLWDEITVKNPR